MRIVPVELCETRQSFAHFNRSIRGEGGEVTFCFSLLLPAFPFSRRSEFFIFSSLPGRQDCVNCGTIRAEIDQQKRLEEPQRKLVVENGIYKIRLVPNGELSERGFKPIEMTVDVDEEENAMHLQSE